MITLSHEQKPLICLALEDYASGLPPRLSPSDAAEARHIARLIMQADRVLVER